MRKLLFPVMIIVVLILGYLGWYLFSPLFIDKVVNEEAPDSLQVLQENNSNEHEEMLNAKFTDADSFHKTSGEVLISNNYLRLENFQTTNGPDLYVYLAKDVQASEFISLGKLKGNIGNQNYEIPPNTHLEEYNYVLIWCKQFGVLFGWAELR